MSSRQVHAVTFDVRRFRRRLLGWYDTHRRDLPWRRTSDPYRVWLAEIMLQQTRVAAVVEHYARFLKRFPTVEALALAPPSRVLAAWSGLGYYRRARGLHQAAKTIVQNGRFPSRADQLRSLPGTGRYTAAAVASIAFGEPIAVVDGNVERVLRRLTGNELPRRELWNSAETLLTRTRPGDFNQAMMELGALICLPRQPKCLMCPVSKLCRTRGMGSRPKVEVRQKREICYGLDLRDDAVFLVYRPKSSSLMPGMWELPEIREPQDRHQTGLTLKHSITVTDYTVRVARGPVPDSVQGQWVRRSRLAAIPLTGLARKILQTVQVIQ
jgi:A/G-specific adenine glycosylase